MSNSKRSIYKPKKGRNVSQKKLYKLPSKKQGQKGGGFVDSLQQFFKGGEVPGSPEGDGEGNVQNVENDNRESNEMDVDSTPEDSEQKVKTTQDIQEESDMNVDSSEEKPTEDEESDKKGFLQGVGETMNKSLQNTTSEIQDYITKPNEFESSESTASESTTPVSSDQATVQISCNDILEENKRLREKIDELQEEIKELLKKEVNKLEGDESVVSNDFSQDSTGFGESSSEESTGFGQPSLENEVTDMDQTSMDSQTPDDNSEMEISPIEQDGSPNEMSISMDPQTPDDLDKTSIESKSEGVQDNIGGTKKYRKKHRKTKRKKVKFAQ